MTPSQPTREFETQVLDEFRERLLHFCADARRRRVDPRQLGVVSTVVMRWRLPELREVLRPYATRILDAELAGAQLDDVFFAVDEDLPKPWFTVAVEGRMREVQAPAAESRPDQQTFPVLVFVLAYARDYRYVFPIAVADQWLAIRRGPPAQDYRREIPLPDDLFVVPSGTLLRLRYRQDGVELLRAPTRPEYSVGIDGQWLSTGEQVRLGRRGTIVFAIDDDRRTELSYSFQERE